MFTLYDAYKSVPAETDKFIDTLSHSTTFTAMSSDEFFEKADGAFLRLKLCGDVYTDEMILSANGLWYLENDCCSTVFVLDLGTALYDSLSGES